MKILCKVCCSMIVWIGLTAVSAMATPINSATSFSETFLQIEVSAGQTTAFSPFAFSLKLSPDPRVESRRFEADGIHYFYDATDVKVVSSTPYKLTLNGTGIAHVAGFDDRAGFEYFSTNRAGGAAGIDVSARVISLPELAVIFLFGLALLGVGVMARRKKSRVM